VDDAVVVSGFERIGDLPSERDCLVEGQWSVHEPIGQCLAVDELEHQRRHAARSIETVNGGNARMIEGRQYLRLALEPGQALGIGLNVRRQNFEGDLAASSVSRAR
jgi:hypothetical protein